MVLTKGCKARTTYRTLVCSAGALYAVTYLLTACYVTIIRRGINWEVVLSNSTCSGGGDVILNFHLWGEEAQHAKATNFTLSQSDNACSRRKRMTNSWQREQMLSVT